MRVTGYGVFTAAVLAAGLVLAALLGLVLLMGDCAAAIDSDTARLCFEESRRQVFAYLVLAPAMWLTGVVLAFRQRPYAMLVGLLSGPVCLAVVSVVF